MTTAPSLSPRNQSRGGGDPVRPPSVAVNFGHAGTRIGECSHLNRLLVKSGSSVGGTASSDRGDREMSVSSLSSEQPIQQLQPAPQKNWAIET